MSILTALAKTDLIKYEDHNYVLFKITPHSTNLNSTSRKIQSSLFELFSHTYDKYPWQRESGVTALKKNNLYVRFKDNPRFLWMVKMKSEVISPIEVKLPEGVEEKETMSEEQGGKETVSSEPTPSDVPEFEQTIEFYIAVPEEFKESFKIKFHNHEQWKKATIEESKEPFQIPDLDNTDLYNLKYSRNDIFSLSYDYSKQTTPVRDIMSLSKDLSHDDEINFFIQTESFNRKKWKQVSDYSWGVWDKGNVPSKKGFDPSMLVNNVVSILSTGFNELKFFIDELLYVTKRSLAYKDDSTKPEKSEVTYKNPERENLLINGDLSKMTKKKRNLPVFKTDILYSVTSKDEVKRDMLARSMANAFSELNEDNSLKPVKVTINPKKELDNVFNFRFKKQNSNLMSVDEVGKLMQLPTADLQKEFEESLKSNKRVEVELDKELLDEKGILVGYATNRGKQLPLHVQTKNADLNATARAFLGSPRMGKDQSVINLVVEGKLKHNKGAVVLDVINEQNGDRGMADAIRNFIPAEEIVDINLLDFDYPVYLGLDSITKTITNARIASDVIAEELTRFLLTDGDENMLQTVEYLKEAAKMTNGDMLAIKHMFTSEKYRKKVMKEKADLFDMDIWEDYNNLSDGKQMQIYTPVMRRIGQMMSSEVLKPIFGQLPNDKLDLFGKIYEGKIVIFRMKSGVMPQRAIEILCYWLVLLTFFIKLAQDGKSDQNSGTYLVLNEPHQYLTKGLATFIKRIFAEGPKYRLTPLLIFHNFKQFREISGFSDMMKSSSLNWHIFKNTNEEVYKELFPYLKNTFEDPEHAFEATKQYQYIGVFLNSMGAYYDPFVADALPMVKDRYPRQDNDHLTLEHSKKYGRPVEEVLEEIKRRNKDAKDKPKEKTSN